MSTSRPSSSKMPSTATPSLEPQVEYLISNIDKPIVSIDGRQYSTKSLADLLPELLESAAFADDLLQGAKSIYLAKPPPNGLPLLDFMANMLQLGYNTYLNPPTTTPPSLVPSPAPAPAPSPPRVSPPADTRPPTRPQTPPPSAPPQPAPTTSKNKRPRRKTSLASSPPSRPAPHLPVTPSRNQHPATPMDVTPDPRPLTPPPIPLPPPTRPSPPSASAFDKVLRKLAALRREALLLTRRRRPDRTPAATSPRPANAARGPLSYADAARGASKSGSTVFVFNVSGWRGGANRARGVGQ